MIVALPVPVPTVPLPTRGNRLAERVLSVAERREENDPIGGLALHLELDHGKVSLYIDRTAERAYIDAVWPYSGTAMRLVIERARFYGYSLIPEDETPAEVLPNGKTRIWLMES